MKSDGLLAILSWLSAQATTASAIPRQQPNDFIVEGLEDIEPAFAQFEGKMYSGLLPMDNEDREGDLMFWLFAPDQPTSKRTLTIWLNGGPGCSSFFAGIFFEHGPVTVPLSPAGTCCVEENAPFVYNPNNWAKASHMLYVEQPVRTGFSTGNADPQDEKDVSGDFYAFLLNFYQMFTEYQDYDLYIFGESYAGMYVPSIAHEIYQRNEKVIKKKKDTYVIPLVGIGVGNGLIDVVRQPPTRIEYAYYHGMIDSFTRDMLHEQYHACLKDEAPMEEPFHPFNVPDDCGLLEAISLAAGKNAMPDFPSGPNIYDATTWDPYAVLVGDDNSISRFYNNPAVKEKLHAPTDIFWHGCIPGAGRRRRRRRLQQTRNLMDPYLIDDRPLSTVPYIADLLDGGIRVLMYSGDRDMACNFLGTEQLLNEMEWGGADKWYKAPRGLWAVDGQPAGYVKSHKHLSFVVMYNSGHLAPYNNPVFALDLVTRFLAQSSFHDYDLPNYGDYVDNKKTKNSVPMLGIPEPATPQVSPGETTGTWSLRSMLPIMVSFAAGFGVAYFLQQRYRGGYQRI